MGLIVEAGKRVAAAATASGAAASLSKLGIATEREDGSVDVLLKAEKLRPDAMRRMQPYAAVLNVGELAGTPLVQARFNSPEAARKAIGGLESEIPQIDPETLDAIVRKAPGRKRIIDFAKIDAAIAEHAQGGDGG